MRLLVATMVFAVGLLFSAAWSAYWGLWLIEG